MSILKAAAASKVARMGVALGLTAGAVVGVAQSSQAAIAVTVAPATGPSVTANVLTLGGTGFKSATGVNAVNNIYAVAGTVCATSGTGVTAITTKSIVSATKIVLTTPALAHTTVSGVHSKKDYLICVYATNGTTLFGSGKYTVYPRPTVTSLDVTSGSVLGGNTITVGGTGFTAKSTVTVGGTAATNVKVATDGLSLTATVPSHAAGDDVAVLVTTEGGTSTDTAADNYDYLNGVVVAPQFAKNGVATPITVRGVGFSAMDFSGAGDAAVLFVAGEYDPTDSSGSKTVAEADTCDNVQVVSDTELVCDTPAALTDAAYTVTVVNDDQVDAQATPGYLQSVVSSTSTITFAAF